MTNLLPPERRRALSRDFMLRIGVVAAVLIMVLTLVAGTLLVPTYVFLVTNASAKKAHLAQMESTLSSGDEAALSARLAALSTNAAKLTALSSTSAVSAILRSALAVSRAGITLNGFSYTPVTGKASGTLAITGFAATRDALRNYQLTLQGAPFARSATLPVSAFAKDTDIPFTITVTLAP